MWFPLVFSVVSCSAPLKPLPQFKAPFRVLDGGTPIHVDTCHAAPLYVDYDEDGRRELLVGQFGEGRVRIYKNRGSEENPRFEGFEWLKAGDEIASVPSG